MSELRADIAAEARALGFADFGIARPAIGPAGARLGTWIAEGHHGAMAWMADRLVWRADPAALWPQAQSVIMLAEDYTPERDPLAALAEPDRAAISVYADGRDYHDVVKKRLKRLGRWLIDRAARDGMACEIKVFVDTAPVMEKPLAAAAGTGLAGQAHQPCEPQTSAHWFFLGAIFTTLDLATRHPSETDHCGSCRRCLDICPTSGLSRALPARCAALHLLSHHRTERPDPARDAPC